MTSTAVTALAGRRQSVEVLPTDEIVRRLVDANGKPARPTSARQGAVSTVLVGCPGPGHGHVDRNPSLSVSAMPDGSTRLHCFAGCKSDDVLASIGLTWKSIRPFRSASIGLSSPASSASRSAERRRAADAIAGLATVQSVAAHDAVVGTTWSSRNLAVASSRLPAGRAWCSTVAMAVVRLMVLIRR
jgi:hypothetical protein